MMYDVRGSCHPLINNMNDKNKERHAQDVKDNMNSTNIKVARLTPAFPHIDTSPFFPIDDLDRTVKAAEDKAESKTPRKVVHGAPDIYHKYPAPQPTSYERIFTDEATFDLLKGYDGPPYPLWHPHLKSMKMLWTRAGLERAQIERPDALSSLLTNSSKELGNTEIVPEFTLDMFRGYSGEEMADVLEALRKSCSWSKDVSGELEQMKVGA